MTARFERINRADALRYMSYRGEPDANFAAEIDRCERDLLAAARPMYVWKAFDLVRENGALTLSGCGFTLPGADIAKHLENCDKAAVIAATLSADADRFLTKQSALDSLRAMISDALASALVEQTSEAARQAVQQAMEGYSASWVYAAGYGDFPLEMNGLLCACVDAPRQIGLSVTGSHMLTPQKSIVGVAGLSKTGISSERDCSSCSMRDICEYRRSGIRC